MAMKADDRQAGQQASFPVGALADASVLVVGDVMLDRFIDGDIRRISPEAPIPIFVERRERRMLGGAGNVAANIASLGGTPLLIGAAGQEAAGHTLRDLAAALEKTRRGMLTASATRTTTVKTRFVAQGQQVLRHDVERIAPLDAGDRAAVVAAFADALPEAGIVILSDYGKGVLAAGTAAALIALAKSAGRTVVVDPKGDDFSIYRGADYITPNLGELAQATGRDVDGDDAVVAAARTLIERLDFRAVLVTRGAQGISVVSAADADHIPATAREVFDVSGAGDTVVGVLALGLAAGLDLGVATRIANSAAGIVVGKRGTAQVSPHELSLALRPNGHDRGNALVDAEAAARLADAWRRDGQRVGFTNGCFDLLHAGHVTLIEHARANCDRLIVALNSDRSVRTLKGPGRPINDERTRAIVLAALSAVDLVVVFDETTPEALIRRIGPDVLVKGADYTLDKVVGADFVIGRGGQVLLVPLVPDHSTTATISRIAEG